MKALKRYQEEVIKDVINFFEDINKAKERCNDKEIEQGEHYNFMGNKYSSWQDKPKTGQNKYYPRVCIKMPTGGGKTIVAIETIRTYQEKFAMKKTGLVVWITHRSQIYSQTIKNLKDKTHFYRQKLDQISNDRILIFEKRESIKKEDIESNLVVLMLMIQSAKERNKMFEDSSEYVDFFPDENNQDKNVELLKQIPNLNKFEDDDSNRIQIKTSLGNMIRMQNALFIVDEFHKMFTDNAKEILDGFNPSCVIGLSATPNSKMNIVSEISGRELKNEEMIKLPICVQCVDSDWNYMLKLVVEKRRKLEEDAEEYKLSGGHYIRPIALIQVERTGGKQRGKGFVHSEDVKEALVELDVPRHQIAVKSSSIDEIKSQDLLSESNEIRYILTKEALKEGWDCSFAYVLGIIPNAQNNSSMTQLVGRILRQPYASRTEIESLDKSYVFSVNKNTQDVLEKVKKGLEREGLKDINREVTDQSNNQTINEETSVRIRKDIIKRYEDSLFLPVWLIKEKENFRRVSYLIDIKSKINWDDFSCQTLIIELIENKKQIENRRITVTVVDLNKEGDISEQEERKESDQEKFDQFYLTRRLFEKIGNAFIAYDIVLKVVKALRDNGFNIEDLNKNAMYIANEIERAIEKFKTEKEQSIFEKLVCRGDLILAVTRSDKGFKLPESDVIPNLNSQDKYERNLYGTVDIQELNSLERDIANMIDENPNVLWWTRNKATKEWYAIQGWRKNKIRPDFVIAKKNKNENLELVYVMESKGEHLIGNEDTQYKIEVFDKMNATKRIFIHCEYTLNEKFSFEVVNQGKEESWIRKELN